MADPRPKIEVRQFGLQDLALEEWIQEKVCLDTGGMPMVRLAIGPLFVIAVAVVRP